MNAESLATAVGVEGVDGIVVVDKPAGSTSHQVVARVRKLAGFRKVGHAGTLDPMATGVLVVGLNRATRLLGYLQTTDKSYDATIRLGAATSTDDADGELLTTADPSALAALTPAQVEAAAAAFRGELRQVPSTVSAIKIDGRRAYARARAGEAVELSPRRVTVSRYDVVDIRPVGSTYLDVAVSIDCSSGTYVRALARDLGAALGVGGHLTTLRRTRVGSFELSSAWTLEQLASDLRYTPIAEVATAIFARYDATAKQAEAIRNGRPLAGLPVGDGLSAMFGPDGAFLALYERHGPVLKPVAVFVG